MIGFLLSSAPSKTAAQASSTVGTPEEGQFLVALAKFQLILAHLLTAQQQVLEEELWVLQVAHLFLSLYAVSSDVTVLMVAEWAHIWVLVPTFHHPGLFLQLLLSVVEDSTITITMKMLSSCLTVYLHTTLHTTVVNLKRIGVVADLRTIKAALMIHDVSSPFSVITALQMDSVMTFLSVQKR